LQEAVIKAQLEVHEEQDASSDPTQSEAVIEKNRGIDFIRDT